MNEDGMLSANESLQRTAGLRYGQFVAEWPAAAEFWCSMKTNLRVIWMFFALANIVAWAQEPPTISPIPEPALSQLKDFESRVRAAVEGGKVVDVKALYQINGVTAEELNSELARWKPMVGQGGKPLLLYFKEISKLPPESRSFWSNEAHRLTQHEVTHFAFVRSGTGVQLHLPVAVIDGRMLVVPSEKIAVKAIEPGGPANQSQPVRPDTNRRPAAAGSGR